MDLTEPVSGEDPAALTVPAEIMRYRTPDGRLALQDQVAVVTGGASGIGFAAARALAANGATVGNECSRVPLHQATYSTTNRLVWPVSSRPWC